jgi:hypothetical protein
MGSTNGSAALRSLFVHVVVSTENMNGISLDGFWGSRDTHPSTIMTERTRLSMLKIDLAVINGIYIVTKCNLFGNRNAR